jgi:uncharacterized protein with WD repeat
MFTVTTPVAQRVYVYDATGRVVFSASAQKGNTSFTLPTKGFYLIKVGNVCVKDVAE